MAASRSAVFSELAAERATRVSNDLYDFSELSAYEMDHGFSRSFLQPLKLLPQELFAARETVQKKQKLFPIFLSKNTTDRTAALSDLVEVYIKREMEERRKWTPSRTTLAVDPDSGTFNASSSYGSTIQVAFEDIRSSVLDHESLFANAICEAKNILDYDLEGCLSTAPADLTSHDSSRKHSMPADQTFELQYEHTKSFEPIYSCDSSPPAPALPSSYVAAPI